MSDDARRAAPTNGGKLRLARIAADAGGLVWPIHVEPTARGARTPGGWRALAQAVCGTGLMP